uniref:Reverse transcriptase domain-containing protein n=1 Tax=Tanacetum cinerariifolium TaxID=118510 RepID=A0A6L2KSC8_TANCI|nr:reverse transcriptase domain-containing protein [Tanacetum cinerariifolium]
MEELLQAPTEGYGEAIVIPEILAENFEIKTNLLQLVQSNKFHEPPISILTWDDLVNKFVNQFFPPSKTTHLKNEISRFTQRFEETFGEAWDRFKEMLRACPHHGFSELTQIDTFCNGLTEQDQDFLNAAVGGNLLNKTTREALKIIENKSRVRYLRSKSNVSRVNTNSRDIVSKTDDRIDKLTDQIFNLVEIVNKQVIAPAKAVEKTCVTCGGAHAYYDCIATDGNQPSVCVATGSYNQINVLRGDFNKQEENLRRHLNNDMRSILGSFFQNQPSTSDTLSSNTVPNPKGKMKAVTTRSGLAYEGPSIPTNSPLEKVNEQNTEEITNKEHSNCPESTAQVQPPIVPIAIPETDVSRTQPKPTIPYPSRLADPGKFLIPCDFSGMEVCHALADLGASINLMPLSIWKNLSLPELTPTRMTLELADRSITRPKGVAEDVFVKVEKFHFPTDFVVVDFEADPRVPLILGRSFLRTGRALIDVYGEEITLRVNDKSVTFNLNQTKRCSSTYDEDFMNRVDAIDIAYEEFVKDVLDFQYNPKSSNPTLISDPSNPENDLSKEPIIKSYSPTLTLFGESDFFLEEIKDFLNDDSIPTGIENFVYDPEGDILFLEKLLNEDPFQLPPMDLKLTEESKAKSSIEEPPELELKELPSHLEYAFLEKPNKLPVIIAKDLKDVEREALINVLKSHKRAIAWKISDIKGIDLRFYTHKILMEDDYKPAVQSQRRVNPKIHDVIKKEVIKLLDADMIYHISDSPWVSPIQCVPKKGRMTVVANENNELIPTRLVTGWRVCIDYRKLNDATRKDHFSLPFMDQMLERLAGNDFYCFLDGFSGYFQIPIDPQDQEKTTFTCLYGTFAYRRMPFGLCNAPDTFQMCMMSIFHGMIEKTIEGIVLGHKILKSGIEVDRAKADVIAKLHHPTTVKGVRSFLDHAGFYRRFIQDFSKIARPMTHLLKKETPCVFSKECIDVFNTLKKKLTEAPILVVHDWNLPFELMCDASDFAIGAKDKMPQNNIQVCEIFDIWGIDFMGPFPSSKGNKYILVAVDDLSMWVEAKALPTNDARVVVKVMIKYGVTHRLATAYHPQTSGQVKVSNHGLKQILERTVWGNRASWLDKLDDALWAFRTAYKTPIGCTPYKLVYGKSCHLLIELEHRAYWVLNVNFDLKIAGDHRKLQLNKLSELRDQAYENSVIYKERTKKLHDSKIKNSIFNVGDQVLLFNSRLKIFSRKLKTRWSGPFTITKVFSYCTIELSQPNGPNFKVNGHRVKHYFGGDIPSNVALDLHTLPMDK